MRTGRTSRAASPWVGYALGAGTWIVVYVAGMAAYGLLLVVLADVLVARSEGMRDLLFALLVALVMLVATFVASVVVRRAHEGRAWWLLVLPVVLTATGRPGAVVEGAIMPVALIVSVAVGGSAAVIHHIGTPRGTVQ